MNFVVAFTTVSVILCSRLVIVCCCGWRSCYERFLVVSDSVSVKLHNVESSCLEGHLWNNVVASVTSRALLMQGVFKRWLTFCLRLLATVIAIVCYTTCVVSVYFGLQIIVLNVVDHEFWWSFLSLQFHYSWWCFHLFVVEQTFSTMIKIGWRQNDLVLFRLHTATCL